MYDSILQGQDWLGELINGHPNRIVNSLRMHKNSFEALCRLLIDRGYLTTSRTTRVGVRESVAIFLTTVGFSSRQRTTCERFQHSLETVSRHVKRVAKALCRLAPELIKPPDLQSCHQKILHDPLLYPYFKDCVGAIDGTLVSAWAPAKRHNAFRSRKSEIAQNVLAVCDFDLMFTYVLAGWEGSANDARVLMDALRRDGHFPWPPQGKYYLVDSGFCNFPGFLAPYRQHRYHINSWRGAMFEPRRPEELFNKRHSRLRNAIERSFGVLKGRFPILKGPMPCYSVRRQVDIIIACFVLHNWLRLNYRNDNYFVRAERGEFDPDDAADDAHQIAQTSQTAMDEQSHFRDTLAHAMWANRR
ncbi:hypothetical protein DH2020_022626 [Rehmannia glutinosa]|uniref:DDE Tnp4 domain-containing protein n=1 Tax=Rehmannia glutinosa TaxID=99300 RepID=A0ABR0W662_REHGL